MFMRIVMSLMALHLEYRGNVLGYFFFFQAEDGIRDLIVTGVQTCALPIFSIAAQYRIRPNVEWELWRSDMREFRFHRSTVVRTHTRQCPFWRFRSRQDF